MRFGLWVKPNYPPQISGDRPATGWEAVAILHRQGKKQWNGGGHCAVWQDTNALQNQKEHPTQKPISLYSKWIELFTNPGDTVLDPFMGSGTTGVACMKLGRNFIGIEKDAGYFKIAERRIAEAQAQLALPLFA